MRVIIEKQGPNPPRVEHGRVYAIDPVGFLADVKVDVPENQCAVYSDLTTTGAGEDEKKCALIHISRIEPDPDLSIGTIESTASILFVAENEYEAEQVWGLHSFLSMEPHILMLMTDQNLDCRMEPFEQLMRR